MRKIIKVQLFPCHCGRWVVDLWHTPEPGQPDKQEHAFEAATVGAAMLLYSHALGDVRMAVYDKQTDSYRGVEDANFIVTGSHAYCSECRTSHQLNND